MSQLKFVLKEKHHSTGVKLVATSFNVARKLIVLKLVKEKFALTKKTAFPRILCTTQEVTSSRQVAVYPHQCDLQQIDLRNTNGSKMSRKRKVDADGRLFQER